MRLLIGPRPRVDVVELVIFSLERERTGLGPGAQDEIVRLDEAALRFGGIDAHRMIFGADAAHETGDQLAAGDVVEDGVFLGDHQRVVHQRQGPPQDRDAAVLDAPRQRARQHAGGRHHAIGGLVMLVDDDAVEAQLVGRLELIEILVVQLRALLGIVVGVGIGHPCRTVLGDRLEIGVGIGHQVEVEDFHAVTLSWAQKEWMAAAHSSAFSRAGRWPHEGNTMRRAPGIRRCHASA